MKTGEKCTSTSSPSINQGEIRHRSRQHQSKHTVQILLSPERVPRGPGPFLSSFLPSMLQNLSNTMPVRHRPPESHLGEHKCPYSTSESPWHVPLQFPFYFQQISTGILRLQTRGSFCSSRHGEDILGSSLKPCRARRGLSAVTLCGFCFWPRLTLSLTRRPQYLNLL